MPLKLCRRVESSKVEPVRRFIQEKPTVDIWNVIISYQPLAWLSQMQLREFRDSYPGGTCRVWWCDTWQIYHRCTLKSILMEMWLFNKLVTKLPPLRVELPDDVAHDDYHGSLLVAGAESPAEWSAGYLPLPPRVILPLSLDNSLAFKTTK